MIMTSPSYVLGGVPWQKMEAGGFKGVLDAGRKRRQRGNCCDDFFVCCFLLMLLMSLLLLENVHDSGSR